MQLMERACKTNENIQKIVLLSSDSLPLYNFKTIQTKIYGEELAWVQVIKEKEHFKRAKLAFGRPETIEIVWGSQWVILNREHVLTLIPSITEKIITHKTRVAADERVWATIFTNLNLGYKSCAPIYVDLNRKVEHGRCINNFRNRHREKPFTFCRLDESDIAAARSGGALFIRKICPSADVSGLNLK